jgi:predicted ferric reductase
MILDRIIAQSGDVFATTDGQDSRAEIIRKMIEGVQYTQWAIMHYQYTLISIVLVFSIWHGLEKYFMARRITCLARRSEEALISAPQNDSWRHDRVQDRSGSSGGSSTTLFADACVGRPTKTIQDADDRSPLLSRSRTKSRISSRIQSFLIYQPPPIIFFNKTLPENATTLLILALFAINIFYIIVGIVWEVPLILVLSDRASLIFAANLPWLYILGAKNQPLRLLTGYSYEHLNILHRRLGEWLCFVALVHTVSMFVVWYTFFMPDGHNLQWFLTEKTVYLGLITLFCYEALYATSLASFRKWWYELFLGLHVVLQAGALGFLYFHHRGSKPYVRVTLPIFLLDRLVFRLLVKSREFKANIKVMPDGNTVLLSGNWPVTPKRHAIWTTLFGHNMRSGWAPAEHVFLTIPSLGRKHTFQAHPFTIASAAPSNNQEHAWLDLIIRALDGFTRDLLVHAQTHSRVMIRLEGPYGTSHAFDMLRSSDAAVAVVGGSGIAVAYPMLWALLQSDSHKSHVDPDPEAAAAATGALRSVRRVALIWIVHQSDHIEWLGQGRLDELEVLGLHVVSPFPTSEAGRPDVAALVRGTIQEMKSGESSKVGVMISGPDGMNRAARNCCAQMVGEGHQIDVAVEKFGW